MRQQVYGGKEADETRNASASMAERIEDNIIAEGEWESRMASAWQLGDGYGHRVVAEIAEEYMNVATAYANSMDWSEKERDNFLANAKKRQQSIMSRALRGSATGKKGRLKIAR